MVNKLTKLFYNTILSQALSPCGNYLAVGDIFGTISMFALSKFINPENSATEDDLLPKKSFTVKEDNQINSLLTANSFLFVGVLGEIYIYSWATLKANKTITCTSVLEIPSTRENIKKPEINSLLYNKEKDLIIAGCGDNKIYVFKMESSTVLKKLIKHKDYIHALCGFENDLISSGEDGLICMWDIRNFQATNKIEPFKNDDIARPELGKWIGAISSNEDFLVCGGGPRLSLWHFRTLNPSTIFSLNDNGIHVAELYDNKIFAGGKMKCFNQMNFNGNIITEVPTSCVTTFSVVYEHEPFKLLCIAGSSPKIDVCSNFGYVDMQLKVKY